MKSNRPPIVDPDKLHEEMVAYLDGELPADDSREVEERLATDPKFRGELHQFERAWNLLDELPRTEPDAKFAATTVEMIAVRAADEVRKGEEAGTRPQWSAWLLSAVGMTMALLLGAGVMAGGVAMLTRAGVVRDADVELIADLPVLENLDRYQQVDNLAYLKRLDESGLFAPVAALEAEGTDGTPAIPPAGETPDKRRARIVGLGPREKKELLEKQERFAALAPEAKQKLRTLDHDLTADPQTDQLREVLARYCQWLGTLSPDVRADLRSLEAVPRMARVEALRGKDQKKVVRLQAIKDVHAVAEWTQELAERHRTELIAGLPKPTQEQLRKANPAASRRILMFTVYQHWLRNGFGVKPEVSPAEFADLKGRISPGLKQQMEQASGMAAQWETLTKGLIGEVKQGLPPEVRSKLDANGNVQQQWAMMLPMLSEAKAARMGNVSDEELWRYFHKEMSSEERDNLTHLPREQAVQQLRARYMRAKYRDRFEPGRAGGEEPMGPRLGEPGHRGADERGRRGEQPPGGFGGGPPDGPGIGGPRGPGRPPEGDPARRRPGPPNGPNGGPPSDLFDGPSGGPRGDGPDGPRGGPGGGGPGGRQGGPRGGGPGGPRGGPGGGPDGPPSNL